MSRRPYHNGVFPESQSCHEINVITPTEWYFKLVASSLEEVACFQSTLSFSWWVSSLYLRTKPWSVLHRYSSTAVCSLHCCLACVKDGKLWTLRLSWLNIGGSNSVRRIRLIFLFVLTILSVGERKWITVTLAELLISQMDDRWRIYLAAEGALCFLTSNAQKAGLPRKSHRELRFFHGGKFRCSEYQGPRINTIFPFALLEHNRGLYGDVFFTVHHSVKNQSVSYN